MPARGGLLGQPLLYGRPFVPACGNPWGDRPSRRPTPPPDPPRARWACWDETPSGWASFSGRRQTTYSPQTPRAGWARWGTESVRMVASLASHPHQRSISPPLWMRMSPRVGREPPPAWLACTACTACTSAPRVPRGFGTTLWSPRSVARGASSLPAPGIGVRRLRLRRPGRPTFLRRSGRLLPWLERRPETRSVSGWLW